MQTKTGTESMYIQTAILIGALFLLWSIFIPRTASAVINTYCNELPVFPAPIEWWIHDTVAGTYSFLRIGDGMCVRDYATRQANVNMQGQLSCNSNGTSATLTWNNMQYATQYRVYVDSQPSGFSSWSASGCAALNPDDSCFDVFPPNTSVTFPTTPGRRYVPWMQFVDEESNWLTGTGVVNGGFWCLAPAPVAGACGGNLHVTWPVTPAADWYEIKIDGGPGINVGVATTYDFSGLPPSSVHSIQMRVKTGLSISEWSNPVNGTASAACGNINPTANAGDDQYITQPANSSFAINVSDNDPDGSIVGRSWRSVSGPSAPTILNGNTQAPTFNNLNQVGTYVFGYTVTDNGGASSAEDTMSVVVSAAAANNPIGTFDVADCTNLIGWTCDADNYTTPLTVNIFEGATLVASQPVSNGNRPDVMGVCGGNALHGFSIATPASLKTGTNRTLNAVGVNIGGGSNTTLSGSPKTINCPVPPVTPGIVTPSYSCNAAGTSVTFTWPNPSPAATEYFLRFDTDVSAPHIDVIDDYVGNSWTKNGITPGTNYYFWIHGGNGGSNWGTDININPGFTTPSPFSCPPPGTPDLIPQVVTAPAASVVAGNNITIAANARNQGSVTTGVGFSNNITYQWNGTGGTWRNFSPNQVFAKAALAAGGTTAPNDSYTFSTTTIGTLYIQYCVDSTGAIAEGAAGELNNCYVSGGTVVSAAGTPDLIPQVVTAPAASVVAGNNITIAANARNQGSVTTGVGFSNNITYQWNGTGGTWRNFSPNQVFAKAALAAGGTTAPNDSYTFSTTTIGTLYIQYCVDSTGAIAEGAAGELNNCYVSGGTVVSAAGPFVTIRACDLGGANCVPTGGTKSINAGDQVEIQWSSGGGITACGVLTGGASGFAFVLPGLSGTDNTITEPGAGLSQVFAVRCIAGFNNYDASVTVSTNAPTPPTVILPTSAAVTQTTATLGATVSSGGSSAITARGTCWGLAANPSANCVAEGGTAVSLFTHARAGFTPGTNYFYRGYATNAAGTGYSPDGTFEALANVPGVITVTPQACGTGQNFLDWPDALGADNYSIYDASTNAWLGNSIGSNYTHTGALSTAYTYYVRANNTSGAQSANSASSASATTLGPCGPPSGTLTAPNCTIPAGSGTCVSSISWTTSNLAGTPSVRQGGVEFSTAASSVGTNRTLTYGFNTFDLYDTANMVTPLDTEFANATCAVNTSYSVSDSLCIETPTVDISVNTNSIFVGDTVTITWDSLLGFAPDNCITSGNGFVHAMPPTAWSGSEVVTPPLGNNTYTLQCENAAGTRQDTESVNVTVNPLSANPEILVNKKITAAGTQVILSWDSNNSGAEPLGETACTLTGGGINGAAVLGNGTGDIETGTANITINNRSTFVFTCGGLSDSVTVDIYPVGWEI